MQVVPSGGAAAAQRRRWVYTRRLTEREHAPYSDPDDPPSHPPVRPMRYLSPEEAAAFREDYREKEKEVQRYINVYLAALAAAVGWIIGPQSRPIFLMAVGNQGYNVYAILAFVLVNAMFTSFMIFKGIVIHETMQFVAVLSPPDSVWNSWEGWRRSSHALTNTGKPSVRVIYFIILGLLPGVVSLVILYHLAGLLLSSPTAIGSTLNHYAETVGSQADVPKPEQLARVFPVAWYWLWFAAAFHLVPLWFLVVQEVKAKTNWRQIGTSRNLAERFPRTIAEISPTIDTPAPVEAPAIRVEVAAPEPRASVKPKWPPVRGPSS
jgi:hypothetical protein